MKRAKNILKDILIIIFGILIFVSICYCIVMVATGIDEMLTSKEARDLAEQTTVEKYIDLQKVVKDSSYTVYYDKNTGIMYLEMQISSNQSGITPILNADGTPKIYEGWNSK